MPTAAGALQTAGVLLAAGALRTVADLRGAEMLRLFKIQVGIDQHRAVAAGVEQQEISAIGARQMLTVESVVVTIYNKVQAGYLFCGAECAILQDTLLLLNNAPFETAVEESHYGMGMLLGLYLLYPSAKAGEYWPAFVALPVVFGHPVAQRLRYHPDNGYADWILRRAALHYGVGAKRGIGRPLHIGGQKRCVAGASKGAPRLLAHLYVVVAYGSGRAP